MKNKKKIKILLLVLIPLMIIICILALAYYIYVNMDMKAVELTQIASWENNITYDMFSDKLKNVISEEEFYDRTDSGKLSLYRKLENLKVEERRKYDPSTDWWKTPQCFDCVEVDGEKYLVEIGFDVRSGFFGIKVINFYTQIYKYE